MATHHITKEELDAVKQNQVKAITALNRSRKVMRALRSLTEDRLEKSLVAAGNEALERSYLEVSRLGEKLRHVDVIQGGFES